jgi:hypothetical protein
MPTGSNWLKYLYVNLGFWIYFAMVIYFVNLAEIRKNWPLYRCNPMYMLFAENVDENFVQCIQASQMNFMGYVLQPMEFITSSLSGMMGSFSEELNAVRAMFSKVRGMLGTTVEGVFGVFINIVIKFQEITIAIKDTFAKTVGIMMTLIYVLSGSLMTMNSAWNGPPGQMIKAVGKCFHPSVQLLLSNGKPKKISEVKLGDELQGNRFVRGVILLDNKAAPETFYELNGVLVTGSHFVLEDSKWVQVYEHKEARERKDVESDVLYCLITSDHKIRIHDMTFHDWEDDYLH